MGPHNRFVGGFDVTSEDSLRFLYMKSGENRSRNIKMFMMAVSGQTYKSIANRFGVSQKTAEKMVARVFRSARLVGGRGLCAGNIGEARKNPEAYLSAAITLKEAKPLSHEALRDEEISVRFICIDKAKGLLRTIESLNIHEVGEE